MIPALLAVSERGAGWIRVLGILPPTSGTVMAGRPTGLLIGVIWLFLRAADRVFRLGMLVYERSRGGARSGGGCAKREASPAEGPGRNR